MPVVMAKPSFDNFSPKGKKVSKEYGGSDSGSSGPSPGGGGRTKKSGEKRSFLQKAKRFGKQGRHGKGTEVDSETYTYFVRILELLRKDEFDTDEDRETLVENSLSLAEGCEVKLSSNQLVSRVVENMLPLASEDRIFAFCESFTPSLRVIVSDPFASHVLEKLLELTSSDKWRASEKLTAWFEKTSMFIMNNFEDFTFDTYGSFVTKKVLECLSGHVESPNEPDIAGPKGSKSSILRLELYGDRSRNPQWQKMLQDFAKRFAAWPQFNDLGHRAETSRLLQNVIQTVSRTEKSAEVVKELIVRVLGTLPETLEADSSLHRILEVALPVADKKMYGKIFDKYYKGNLIKYVHGPCFTLQKVISAAPTEQHFIVIFDELAPEIKSIMLDGRTVIIHHLASQCVKFGTRQKELWKLLKDSFKAMKNDSIDIKSNILMALITIKPKTEKSEPIQSKFTSTYFGSALVQLLMDFVKPVASDVLKSFDELPAPDIMKLALDPKASFVISKMFKAWNVPQEHKEKLLQKLQDSLVELATTKFGSRIIDLIWLWADISQKTNVATVLSQRIPVLTANKYGRYLVDTMGLQALVRNKKEWTEHIVSQDKRRRDADKIAADLGLKAGDTSISEESKSKKAKKRKSEAPQETIAVEQTDTPKKSKKNKKSIGSAETPKQAEVVLKIEPETPKKSKKKDRKSNTDSANQSEVTSELEPETPKKSKKKNRKSNVDSECSTIEDQVKVKRDLAAENLTQGESGTPNKKKKNKKSESFSGMKTEPNLPEEIETPKKKKKARKSENHDEEVNATSELETETPKKKKKKDRSSQQF